MTAESIQSAIETRLAGVVGLTATPEVMTLALPLKQLPAAWAVFEGFDSENTSTAVSDLTGRWRVPVLFSYAPPKEFAKTIARIVPAIHAAFRSGIDGAGTVRVEDGGEPEILEASAGVLIVRKVLFVTVEYED